MEWPTASYRLKERYIVTWYIVSSALFARGFKVPHPLNANTKVP